MFYRVEVKDAHWSFNTRIKTASEAEARAFVAMLLPVPAYRRYGRGETKIEVRREGQ